MNAISRRWSSYAAHENAKTWALSLAQLISWGSIYYSFSLLLVPMEQTTGWGRTSMNAALSVGLLISGFAAYPIGTLIDRGYGRIVMSGGSILGSAMLLLWSHTHALPILFVVWAGLGVAMAATFYDPVFAVVTRDYPNNFRTKITLITLVAGFASTVFIPLTQGLVGWYGWRWALIALASVNLLVAFPINWLAVKGNRRLEADRTASAAAKIASQASANRALRTPTFWALAISFTAYYATFAALTFHLVPLMVERKVSNALILATMATIGPAQVAARALMFAFGRNVKPAPVGIVVTIAFPVSVLLLLCAGTSTVLLLSFALIYGGANGMMTILRGTIVQDVMWTEGYGAVSGMLSMPSNIAKGIAPISAAAIWAIGHNYAPVEWTVFGVSLLSAAAFFVAMRSSRINQTEAVSQAPRV